MKEIRIPLEDEEHKQLLKQKGDLTWKQFLKRGDNNERRKKDKSYKARDD